MLGRYTALGSMGIDVQEIIGTTAMTTETIQEITPAIKQMAVDYERVSPFVNFMADYWYTALALIFASGAAGAAVGSWFVLKRLEK